LDEINHLAERRKPYSMKKATQSKRGITRILSAFFALSMLFLQSAPAQEKLAFTGVKNLAYGQCHESQLSVRHVSEDAAMGGVRTVGYAFTNTSSSPCALKGYPRFEILNKSGRVVRGGRAANGLSRMGDDAKMAPRSVTIEPGKTATFLIYYNAGGAGYMGKPCPTYGRVRITAPGAKRGFVLRDNLQLCGGLEVSPVGAPSAE
jgi:hypothetical protein